MADYRETQIAGKSWRRAVRVVCENPMNGTPSVNFVEQDVVSFDGKYVVKDAGNLYGSLTVENMNDPIPLVNPTTDELIGTTTRAEVHAVLYSLYRHLANERDASDVQAAAEQVTP